MSGHASGGDAMTAAPGVASWEPEPGRFRQVLGHRGRYGMLAAAAAGGPPEVVDTLLAWPRHADWI